MGMTSKVATRIFLISGACIVAVSLLYFILKGKSAGDNDREKNRAKMIAAVANQGNQLPKKVNSFTEWTKVEVNKDEITNTYVVDRTKLAVPFELFLSELTTTGKKNIINQSKRTPNFFFQNGFHLAYRYVDNEGKLIHEFKITESDIADSAKTE